MGIHGLHMSCLVFFLLLFLLPPPISKAKSLRYRGPGWKLFHRLSKGSKSYQQRQVQQMRQNWSQGESPMSEDCLGVFDLYIILDKSGSVGSNWIHVYSFADDLVKKFQNPKMRISVITFSTEAEVIIPLTSDREEIQKGLLTLLEEVPDGFTHMQKGIHKAIEQIQKANLEGTNVNSVIIALTDGTLMDKPFKQTVDEAQKARELGATIFTVGVHDFDKTQMVEIADSPSHSLAVQKGFSALQSIVDTLAAKTCIEVLSVQPSYVCIKGAYQVNISGRGFSNAKDMSQVICRFTFNDSRIVDEGPTDMNDKSISCPGPRIQRAGEEVSLQVSLNNGISFIGNKLIITGTNCGSTRVRAQGWSSPSLAAPLRAYYHLQGVLSHRGGGTVWPVDPRAHSGPLRGKELLLKDCLPNSTSVFQAPETSAGIAVGSSSDRSSSSSSGSRGSKSNSSSNPKPNQLPEEDPDPEDTTQGKVTTAPNKSPENYFLWNWKFLVFSSVILVSFLLLCCCWIWCCIKRKKKPPPPDPEKDPEENQSPPPISPPAPPIPPSSPSPVNPSPTVIVACCGCGGRGIQGNLGPCCSCFHPGYHQMPMMWCHPKVQGRSNNFTLVNPSCTHASCSPKLCLPSNRDYLHLRKPSHSSRIVIQPSRGCFPISQAPCRPKICLKAGRECLPVAPSLCSKVCPPSQKCYTLDCSQSSYPNKCTPSPSKMLPLLPPHARQSVETLCQAYPCRPSSKEPKF
ncbi:anthrax toxin receptor-like [Microtus ochrogaster]|uniref:Anthrax toxin receptor-like n=1 Tax=Microtus ochrogaster TaxID=79684 RepID=A0ABM0KLG5_MICOH|nr:anthrax toxin receptor-like [Microtus ochrogaster]